jgi:WD40 repeat protein
LRAFDLNETPYIELKAHNNGVDHLAFSQDGVYLASAGEDGVIKFWAAEEYMKLFDSKYYPC